MYCIYIIRLGNSPCSICVRSMWIVLRCPGVTILEKIYLILHFVSSSYEINPCLSMYSASNNPLVSGLLANKEKPLKLLHRPLQIMQAGC